MINKAEKGLEDLQKVATLNGILRAAMFLHENGQKAAAAMVTEFAVKTFPGEVDRLANKANTQGENDE